LATIEAERFDLENADRRFEPEHATKQAALERLYFEDDHDAFR
jgi:hypothetical protein